MTAITTGSKKTNKQKTKQNKKKHMVSQRKKNTNIKYIYVDTKPGWSGACVSVCLVLWK